jgi:hypothetical protein
MLPYAKWFHREIQCFACGASEWELNGCSFILIENTTSSAALHSEESGAFRRWVSTSRLVSIVRRNSYMTSEAAN